MAAHDENELMCDMSKYKKDQVLMNASMFKEYSRLISGNKTKAFQAFLSYFWCGNDDANTNENIKLSRKF